METIGRFGGYYLDEEHTQWSNFASRNPDMFKAVMITSGGLSGGISSTIAGGNFWAGARQGIITAGLNHVAHEIEVNYIKNKIDKLLENMSAEEMIEKFMALKNGTKITGEELSTWSSGLAKADKIIDYIQKTQTGLYLDLKFGVETTLSFTKTKLEDNSNFTIQRVFLGKEDYYHIKGPGTLRGDPFDIYVNNDSYRLKLGWCSTKYADLNEAEIDVKKG